MLDILDLELIPSSIIAVAIAIVIKVFLFSVSYARSEYLQFEDDEYYYYVKAVPKVSVAVREKTVKKINAHQNSADKETESKIHRIQWNSKLIYQQRKMRFCS